MLLAEDPFCTSDPLRAPSIPSLRCHDLLLLIAVDPKGNPVQPPLRYSLSLTKKKKKSNQPILEIDPCPTHLLTSPKPTFYNTNFLK